MIKIKEFKTKIRGLEMDKVNLIKFMDKLNFEPEIEMLLQAAIEVTTNQINKLEDIVFEMEELEEQQQEFVKENK